MVLVASAKAVFAIRDVAVELTVFVADRISLLRRKKLRVSVLPRKGYVR